MSILLRFFLIMMKERDWSKMGKKISGRVDRYKQYRTEEGQIQDLVGHEGTCWLAPKARLVPVTVREQR